MSAPASYLETTWSGLPLYLCLLDGHQDFDQAVFAEHMQVTHQEVLPLMAPAPAPAAAPPEAVAPAHTSDEPVAEVEVPDPDAPVDVPSQGEADADTGV